jgi:hypothetical protein
MLAGTVQGGSIGVVSASVLRSIGSSYGNLNGSRLRALCDSLDVCPRAIPGILSQRWARGFVELAGAAQMLV